MLLIMSKASQGLGWKCSGGLNAELRWKCSPWVQWSVGKPCALCYELIVFSHILMWHKYHILSQFLCTVKISDKHTIFLLHYCSTLGRVFFCFVFWSFSFFFFKKLSGSQSLKIQCFSLPQWINRNVIRDFFKKLMQLFKVDCFKIGVYLK